jgi:hypothetical protein
MTDEARALLHALEVTDATGLRQSGRLKKTELAVTAAGRLTMPAAKHFFAYVHPHTPSRSAFPLGA